MMVLLAAAGGTALIALLLWKRAADPALPELLTRFPDPGAVVFHVDVAALRAAGLGDLLEGAPVAEEPEYRRFVTESGFDWKTDLEAVTASRVGDNWYLFVRGRFDMEKLKAFVEARGGSCKNGVCGVAGATPGRMVSFFPLTPRVLALATSPEPMAAYALHGSSEKTRWTEPVPAEPLWLSFGGSALRGDPSLPAGARLFGKVLAEADRTTFWISLAGGRPELRMRATCGDTMRASVIQSELTRVTTEFQKYFERIGQQASDDDLSGLLLAGKFTAQGAEVNGQWPIPLALLRKLAGGAF
jgi:hypothetical protein